MPFTPNSIMPETFHSTAFTETRTYEATEHGLHQPGVELVYHVYPLN